MCFLSLEELLEDVIAGESLLTSDSEDDAIDLLFSDDYYISDECLRFLITGFVCYYDYSQLETFLSMTGFVF